MKYISVFEMKNVFCILAFDFFRSKYIIIFHFKIKYIIAFSKCLGS